MLTPTDAQREARGNQQKPLKARAFIRSRPSKASTNLAHYLTFSRDVSAPSFGADPGSREDAHTKDGHRMDGENETRNNATIKGGNQSDSHLLVNRYEVVLLCKPVLEQVVLELLDGVTLGVLRLLLCRADYFLLFSIFSFIFVSPQGRSWAALWGQIHTSLE